MAYSLKNKKEEIKETRQWYAVYTRPRWEKKTSALLAKKDIETYCPLKITNKQWADRKKIVLEPLFTSYVFIYTTEACHLSIRQTDGVINFVYWLGKPAIIKDIEIQNIKNFLEVYSDVKIKPVEIKNNDLVQITNGPFTMQEGKVIEVRNNTVKLLLPSMGFVIEASLKIEDVKVLRKEKDTVEARNII